MNDVHPEIVAKLSERPDDVRDLALRAIELSAKSSDAATFEALKNWTRDLVRRKAAAE